LINNNVFQVKLPPWEIGKRAYQIPESSWNNPPEVFGRNTDKSKGEEETSKWVQPCYPLKGFLR